jgi:tetraacyldisaccharide 4'-kinase
MKMPNPALSPFLLFPGLLYELIVRLRNGLYAQRTLSQQRLPAPVISVGNLTLGGAGKTPLVIHIARALRTLNATPALLSRGYGRSKAAELHILPPGNEIPSPARILGDEPALIRRQVPEIWLGISANRHEAGAKILQRRTTPVFILDDGFQHRKLGRDLDILVIDSSQPLAQNRVFPRGTLREPLSSMKRADLLVLNQGSSDIIPVGLENVIRKYNAEAPILRCRQWIRGFSTLPAWLGNAATSPPVSGIRRVYLAAAIGNPARFCADISRTGIEVRGHRFLRDHHRPDLAEWRQIAREAAACGSEAIMTTEKDAVKMSCSPDFPVLVALQGMAFQREDELQLILSNCVGKRN